MKINNFYKVAFALLTAAGTLTGCSENAWNNRLPGFEEMNDQPITDVQRLDYTLTAADYKAIADNSTNKALAGEDLSAALAAVGKNLSLIHI